MIATYQGAAMTDHKRIIASFAGRLLQLVETTDQPELPFSLRGSNAVLLEAIAREFRVSLQPVRNLEAGITCRHIRRWPGVEQEVRQHSP